MNNNALELIHLISQLTEEECIQLIKLYNEAIQNKDRIINNENDFIYCAAQ